MKFNEDELWEVTKIIGNMARSGHRRKALDVMIGFAAEVETATRLDCAIATVNHFITEPKKKPTKKRK